MSSRGEKPKVVVYPGASQSPLYNIHQGAYARDTGTAEVSDVAYTGGMFVKGANAAEVYSPSFPVNEWKYLLEGEWHMIQDREKLIAKAGDVVFVPKGAAFTSLPVPFKAFFVTNRGAKDYTGMQAIPPPSPSAKL